MTLQLHSLHPSQSQKKRKTIGRGNASGHGTFSTRGTKGQHARAGGSHVAGFEGGRTTLIMQTPKMRGKGFHSQKSPLFGINVEDLNIYKDGDKITPASLKKTGLLVYGRPKILGGGGLKKKLDVYVRVSASAREKIVQAGGKVIEKTEAVEQKEKA